MYHHTRTMDSAVRSATMNARAPPSRSNSSNSVNTAARTFYGYEDHRPTVSFRNNLESRYPIDADDTTVDGDNDDVGDVTSSSEFGCGTGPGMHYNSSSDDLSLLSPKDYPPMPPDRVARKQRHCERRGGACHSLLLKSAVMASMSYDDNDDDAEGRPPALFTARRASVTTMLPLQQQPTSPRKRARHLSMDERAADAAALAQASLLMQFMGFDDDDDDDEGKTDKSERSLRQQQPHREIDVKPPLIRRVSRRTSYDSRVSRGDDDDDEQLEDLQEEEIRWEPI